MKNIVLFSILMLLVTSCGVRFTPLPLHFSETTDTLSINENGKISEYTLTSIYECVLVENFSRDTAKLIEQLISYYDQHGRRLDSLQCVDNSNYYDYDIAFYKNNRNTRKRFLTDSTYNANRERERDFIGYLICTQCRSHNGKEHLSKDLWEIKILINLNNSESYEYLGPNFKTYLIRDDANEDNVYVFR